MLTPWYIVTSHKIPLDSSWSMYTLRENNIHTQAPNIASIETVAYV